MAAKAEFTVGMKTTELDTIAKDFIKRFTMVGTPDALLNQTFVQTTADTEEALPLGDLTTIQMIILHCKSNDVNIDPSYTAATFRAGMTVEEGEWAVFKPAGSCYVKNNDGAEKVSLEYWIVGTIA